LYAFAGDKIKFISPTIVINYNENHRFLIVDQNAAGTSSVSNMVRGRDKELPSFWIPSLTPESSATALKKPVNKLTHS